MRKVIIIGCPGSGKSTFAIELQKKTGLPLYHLDLIGWNEDRIRVEKKVFLQRLEDIIKQDNWIIDGNWQSSIEIRMKECDTVFFLDYPLETCLDGIKSRKGKKRVDINWIENGEDEEFLNFIKSFEETSKPMILELLEKYRDKNIIILKNRKEAEEFLKTIE